MENFDLLLQEEKHHIYKVPMSTITWYVNRWTRNILPDERRKLLYSYDIECGKYVAIDNTTNECFMQDFKSELDCLKWLGGEV